VRAILSLASELGVEVVAEGVETDTQRRLLVHASAHAHAQGQGFFYSRAVPADETIPMLRVGVMRPEDRSLDSSLLGESGDRGHSSDNDKPSAQRLAAS
jgi:predicted signal transduction protein with EAL and GGDEF domain